MEIHILNKIRQSLAPRLRLPQFEPLPLEFEADELLLDDVAAAYESDSRVVPIVAGAKPAELRARIEWHLRTRPAQPQQERSASNELAEALAQVRRSLR